MLLTPASLLAQTTIRFAVVGDYGDTPPNSGNVSALIAGWNPDFVITTGDNNYTNPTPAPPSHYAAWDGAVGQYYHDFITYPAGSGSSWAGAGSVSNKFFPSLGNHDWDAGIAGWYSYFELPGNERYFDFVRGPVHFFAIDSDPREPDGNTGGSTQGQWLQTRLAASSAPWKFVFFHHPPYTSATRGNNVALQWPFPSWGASAVLNGHEHQYERIMKGSFPYMVVGTGGRSLYGFSSTPEPGSTVRYNANYGAMCVDATTDSVVFRFISLTGGGTVVDRFVLYPSGSTPVQLATFTATFVGAQSVRLDWTTLSELNNFGFHVQKMESGNPPVDIPNSFIPGHGTTLERHAYTFTDSAVGTGPHAYRLRQTDLDGSDHFSEPVQAEIPTGVAQEPPRAYLLFQNYPNPFNPSTVISYQLQTTGFVHLAVYDPLGRLITTLVDGVQNPGVKTVRWNGAGSAAGVYYCVLKAGSRVETRTLVLIR